MFIESVRPFSHLILCRPLLLLPQSLPASESFPMSRPGYSHFTERGSKYFVKQLTSGRVWIQIQVQVPLILKAISQDRCWRRQWYPTPALLPGKSHGLGAWQAAVHGVAKSRTGLSDFTFTFRFHALDKEMATHSSVLAWRIPGMGEPGGLPSMGSHRVGHD